MHHENIFSNDLQMIIAHCNANIMGESSAVRIAAITTRIENFPNEGNNNTTTCSSTVKTSNGPEVTWFSAATDQGQGYPAALQEALVTATSTALQLSGAFIPQGNTNQQQQIPLTAHHRIIDVTPMPQPFQKTLQKTTDKSRFNGGGSKVASPKQREFVQDLAKKRGLSFNVLARERFDKHVEELMGSEVQQLIDELKSQG